MHPHSSSMVVSKPKTSDANPARVSYLSIRQSIRQYIQLSGRRYCMSDLSVIRIPAMLSSDLIRPPSRWNT
jgi:hypothetical protein